MGVRFTSVRADLQSDRSEYQDFQSEKRIANAYTHGIGNQRSASEGKANANPDEQKKSGEVLSLARWWGHSNLNVMLYFLSI